MKNIAALNDGGRDVVASVALDAYNSNWRFGALSMVQVTGSELITLRFTFGEMFSRHNISLTSLDGIDFNEVRIELQRGSAASADHHASH